MILHTWRISLHTNWFLRWEKFPACGIIQCHKCHKCHNSLTTASITTSLLDTKPRKLSWDETFWQEDNKWWLVNSDSWTSCIVSSFRLCQHCQDLSKNVKLSVSTSPANGEYKQDDVHTSHLISCSGHFIKTKSEATEWGGKSPVPGVLMNSIECW